MTFGATQTGTGARDTGALSGQDSSPGADSTPLRRCLATGDQGSKDELLRFVVSPEGILVFDVAGRLPGRGLWLKAGRDMIDTATSKRLFSKAAREAVKVPDNILALVVAGLKRRCLDRLGLARRAGLVAVGFEKVRAQASTGRTVLILEAIGGAKGGRRKLTSLAPEAPVIDVFTGEELGQALGRDHAVHVSLEADSLTDVLVTEAKRYTGVAF